MRSAPATSTRRWSRRRSKGRLRPTAFHARRLFATCCSLSSRTSGSPPPRSSAASPSSSRPTLPRPSPGRRFRSTAAGPRIDPEGNAMNQKSRNLTPLQAVNEIRNTNNGQVVLVLQGGGALGAYQCGVYEALHEAGVEPDWIIGTSSGAWSAAYFGSPALPKLLMRSPLG